MKTKQLMRFTLLSTITIVVIGIFIISFNIIPISHALGLSIDGQCSNDVSGTTNSCNLAVTTGDFIEVVIQPAGSGLPATISDSQSNTWATSFFIYFSCNGQNLLVASEYVQSASSTTTDTVTVTYGSNTQYVITAYSIIGFVGTPTQAEANGKNCHTGSGQQESAILGIQSNTITIGTGSSEFNIICGNPDTRFSMTPVLSYFYTESGCGSNAYFAGIDSAGVGGTGVTTITSIGSDNVLLGVQEIVIGDTSTGGSLSGGTTVTQTTFTTVTTTSTTSIFAINAPNPSTANYWIFGLIALLAPVALLDGFLFERKGTSGIDSGTLAFMTLLGLMLGSTLGLLMNVLPFYVPIAIIIIFGLYMWRGRG